MIRVLPPQHGRPFIVILIVLLCHEMPILAIVLRRRDPLPRHDARQRQADTSGPVEPSRRRPAGQALDEVRGEVVTVLGEQVVGGAEEGEAGGADHGVDFGRRQEREAVQQRRAVSSAWRCLPRPRVVHACSRRRVVPPVGVLPLVQHYAAVQQRGA